MKKKTRNTWILPLMIFSQIILTGFVIYWLVNQYKEEKKILKESLYHNYIQAKEQVIDTILLKNIVHPALQDSQHISIQVLAGVDTVDFLNVDTCLSNDVSENKRKLEGKGVFAIKLGDRALEDSGADAIQIVKHTADDYLMRSVKLFVHQTTDSLNSEDFTLQHFPGSFDTILFKEIFTNRLGEIDFEISWTVDSLLDSLNNNQKCFVFASSEQSELPSILIGKFQIHLLKQILPQIIFVIFLLSLSAFALLFTYRSFKRQLLLNELRESFINNITHELKTPVSTVKIALEALKKYNVKDNPELAKDYLDMANQEMNRLNGLIGKVLNHSLLEDQNDSINKEKVNLVELINNVLQSVQIQIENRNAQVYFETNKSELYVTLDKLLVEGVILNLLDNSLKYVETKPTIKITITEDNTAYIINISDNGPGIPIEFQSKIFDKFFRIPQGDTHNVKGLRI